MAWRCRARAVPGSGVLGVQLWDWGFPLPVGGVGASVTIAGVADGPVGGSGADDLLPILSYVVLRTGLPQLLSECAAMEEFIHEG